jgi:hypothetical protein
LVQAFLFGGICNVSVIEALALVGDGHFRRLSVDDVDHMDYFRSIPFVAMFDGIDNRFFYCHLDVEYIATFPAGRLQGTHQFIDRCMPGVEVARNGLIAFPHRWSAVHQQPVLGRRSLEFESR